MGDTMKMSDELYAKLYKGCMDTLAAHNIDPKLVDTTARAWEVFHFTANKTLGYSLFYGPGENLNDKHIQTALKRIFKL